MTDRKRKILKIAGVIVAQALLLGIMSVLAFTWGFRTGFRPPETIVIRGVKNIESGETTIDFQKFWQVWNALKESYVTPQTINDRNLLDGAIRGMVDALGDPYTVFFSQEDAEEFEQNINGASFGGIGAEIAIRNSQLIVITPLKNSPAEHAGLKSKDIILKIDGISTAGMTIDEAIGHIRGEVDTTVKLLILREARQLPEEIDIVRATITIPTLDWEIKQDTILYIALYSFNEKAPSLFYQTIKEANEKYDIQGIVLDLRGNPGGYLNVAVELASWFIDRGETVVIEEFGDGREHVFPSQRKALLAHVPTVVLIDGGSASASEILAGALRDQRGIVLIGEQTFGKGSVQELRGFEDGSELKVTVAHWVLPKGDVIDKTGLTPDLLVPRDPNADDDTQLTAALQVLQGKIRASQ